MGKVDTTGIEFLEGDFIGPLMKKAAPVKKKGRVKSYQEKASKAYMRPPMELKQPQNGLQGISSLRLARELIVRHYKFVLSTLFWIGVGAVIVILGR